MTAALRFLSIFFLGLSVFSFNSAPLLLAPAHAQGFSLNNEDDGKKGSGSINQYDPKYRKTPRIRNGSKAILANYLYLSSFLRIPDAKPNEITINFLSPTVITGCSEINNLKIDIVQTGIIMRLKLAEPEINVLGPGSVQYAHYECNTRNQFASTSITLDRDDLIKNKTRKIFMQGTQSGILFEMEIKELNKQKITILTKAPDLTQFNIKVPANNNILTYWFYPDNTIILQVPGAKTEQNVQEELIKLAYSRGLIPLEDTLAGFEDPAKRADTAYFTDPSGRFIDKLDSGKNGFFNTITLSETFYGPNGAYQEALELDVYARTPQQSD